MGASGRHVLAHPPAVARGPHNWESYSRYFQVKSTRFMAKAGFPDKSTPLTPRHKRRCLHFFDADRWQRGTFIRGPAKSPRGARPGSDLRTKLRICPPDRMSAVCIFRRPPVAGPERALAREGAGARGWGVHGQNPATASTPGKSPHWPSRLADKYSLRQPRRPGLMGLFYAAVIRTSSTLAKLAER